MDITARRLKEALELRGMRQADLAYETGIGKSAISQYLSGKVLPKQDKIYLLAQALHVNEGWLLGWTDDPTDYDDPSLAANIPIDLLKHFDYNIEAAYKAQQAIQEDAIRESARHAHDAKEIMAKNIRQYMQDNNVTQPEICKTLNIPAPTFSDWVNAKTYPRTDQIELMATYFGIEKSDLVEDHTISPSKHKIEILARNLDELPDEDRDKLIKNFEETIDIYLKARGIKPNNTEEE